MHILRAMKRRALVALFGASLLAVANLIACSDQSLITGLRPTSATFASRPSPPSASCIAITAVQGSPITPVQMVGSGGGGAPYTFSVTGLPAGLTMAANGTITGTPTVTGTFSYTVTI